LNERDRGNGRLQGRRQGRQDQFSSEGGLPWRRHQEEPDANGGSSSPKSKNGNGGNGKGAADEKKPAEQVPAAAPATAVEEPKEKKRKGRAPTEGEPLKRVLIFLSDDDITRLKSEVGERGMSTKVREIIKAYLAQRA
jgi:hypothetical protein